MKGDPGLESDHDFVIWVAIDVPDPIEFAYGMTITAPELAEALLDCKFTPGGYRTRRHWQEPEVRALRSLGLVEVAGFDPSTNDLRAGLGTFLTGYGEVVRQYLRAMQFRQAAE
jgi:hypothetical protein